MMLFLPFPCPPKNLFVCPEMFELKLFELSVLGGIVSKTLNKNAGEMHEPVPGDRQEFQAWHRFFMEKSELKAPKRVRCLPHPAAPTRWGQG